jgi:hypothetical protein
LGSCSTPDDPFEAAISLVAGLVEQLGRTEAMVDVIVIGHTAYGLSLGRGLGTLDRALELLARVQPEGPFDPNALAARVLPRLSSLSCLVFVALRWDAPRRAFVEQVRSMGVSCAPFVVTARADPRDGPPGVSFISVELIRAGGAVTL